MAYSLHRRWTSQNKLEIVKADTPIEPEVAKGCIDGLNYSDVLEGKYHKHKGKPFANTNTNKKPKIKKIKKIEK